MRHFFIDFENTGANGLIGIHRLDSTDKITLMYSENGKIPINISKILTEMKNRVIYYQNEETHANALDFQMVYWIGYISGKIKSNRKSEIIIISNDKGYDVIQNTIKRLNITNVTITRSSSIQNYYTTIDRENDNNTSDTNDNTFYQEPENLILKNPKPKTPKYKTTGLGPAVQYINNNIPKLGKNTKISKVLKAALEKVPANVPNIKEFKQDLELIVKEIPRCLHDNERSKAINMLTYYFTEKTANKLYDSLLRAYRKIKQKAAA